MTVSEMARMGGHAVAAKRTPAERRALAMNAVNARWSRYRAAKNAIVTCRTCADDAKVPPGWTCRDCGRAKPKTNTAMNKPLIQLRAVVREDEPTPPADAGCSATTYLSVKCLRCGHKDAIRSDSYRPRGGEFWCDECSEETEYEPDLSEAAPPAPTPPADAQDFVARAMTADRKQLEALFAEALEHAAALAQDNERLRKLWHDTQQVANDTLNAVAKQRDALAQERDALRAKLDSADK